MPCSQQMIAQWQSRFASPPGGWIRGQGSMDMDIIFAVHMIGTHCSFSIKVYPFCKRHPLYLMLCPHIKTACMYIMATAFPTPNQLRRRPASSLMHVSITDAACILLQWSTGYKTTTAAVVKVHVVWPLQEGVWLDFCSHSELESECQTCADTEHMARQMHRLKHARTVIFVCLSRDAQESMHAGHVLFTTSCVLPLA